MGASTSAARTVILSGSTVPQPAVVSTTASASTSDNSRLVRFMECSFQGCGEVRQFHSATTLPSSASFAATIWLRVLRTMSSSRIRLGKSLSSV